MLVGSVAGVDDRAIDQLGHAGGGAVLAVADDDAVGPHGVERARGILERLALLDRGLFDREENGCCAEAVSGRGKGHRRPCRVFVEKIENQLVLKVFYLAA